MRLSWKPLISVRASRVVFLLAASIAIAGGCALPIKETPSDRVLSTTERRGLNYLREGLFYYNRNRFDDAEERFLRAEALYPEAANIQTNLAVTEGLSGDVRAGLDRIAGLELDDKVTAISVYAARGLLYRLAGSYSAARNAYVAAYELSLERQDFAGAAGFAQSLSSLYFLMGNEHEAWCWQEVVEALGVGVPRKNTEEVVRFMMAAGQYSLAFAKLEKFFELHPGSQEVSLITMQGVALLGLDKKAEALALFRSLMLVPGSRSDEDPVVAMLISYAENRMLETDEEREGAAVMLTSKDALLWPKGFLEYLEGQIARI